jgi:hypothetical protein
MVTVSQSIKVIPAVPHSTSDSVINSLIAQNRCPFSLNP